MHPVASLAVLVLAGLLAGCATLQRHPPPRWLVTSTCIAAGTAGVAEIVVTEACLQRGTCVEKNPLLPHGLDASDTILRGTIKGAGTGVALAATYLTFEDRWVRLLACGSLTGLNVYLTHRGSVYLPAGPR